jgi:hypothetical protein
MTNSVSGAGLDTWLRIVGSVAALGIVPTIVAVIARWIAFALDPTLAGATFLVPALPPVDLVFLGGRLLLSLPTVVVPLLLLSAPAFAPHRAQVRALQRIKDANRSLEEGTAALRDLTRRMIHGLVKPESTKTELDALLAEAERLLNTTQQEQAEAEEARREVDRILLPTAARTYPITRFGLGFSSRRWFIGFLAAAVYFVVASLALVNFPSGFVALLTLVAAFVLLLRAVMLSQSLRFATLAPSIIVALAGATISGAFDYRLPVGTFEAPAVPSGIYAHVGTADGKTYVVPCERRADRVVAIPSATVTRVTFEPPRDRPASPSLLGLLFAPGSSLAVGALLDCREP